MRRLAVLAAAALVVAGATGSGLAAGNSPARLASSSGEAQVLRVALNAFPDTLDPAFVDRGDQEEVATNLFNGLLTYDADGSLIPDLAETWESNEELTQWTFTLREGVMFHHGYGELTADDVVFSYERIRDPETASAHAVAFAGVTSIEAVDDYTVVITLDRPDVNFVHSVANFHQGMVVSRAAVEELGEDFASNPVGTGPFALEEFDSANGIVVLARNDDYFRGPATLSEVRLSVVEDEDAASIALQNGEFDIAMAISTDSALERLEEAGLVLHVGANKATLVTMLNPQTQPAFADVRVRQALLHAIDYASMAEAGSSTLRDEHAISLFPVTAADYTDDIASYEYDPERARELLAEAGYADGFTTSRIVRGVEGVEDSDLLEQEYLAAVGITQEFEVLEVGEYSERRLNGDFEMAGRSITSSASISFVAAAFLHPSQFPPVGLNGSYYDNAEVTELMEQAAVTADEAERFELYHRLQQIVMDELPYLPETSYATIWPAWDYVEGITLDNQAYINFHTVSVGAGD